MKVIKEYPNKWKDIPYSNIGKQYYYNKKFL